MKKTKENGITLIALIITIIVMLILVGVTINVALNGGLFNTAKEAAKGTQYEADREVLQAGILGALNEELKIPNAQALKNNLPDNWKVTGAEGGPYTAISPNNNEFIVYSDGRIKDPTQTTEEDDLDLLKRYFMGEDGKDKNINDLLDIEILAALEDSNIIYFKNDPETIPNAQAKIRFINNDENDPSTAYIAYNGKTYKLITEDKSDENGDLAIVKDIEVVELGMDEMQWLEQVFLGKTLSNEVLEELVNNGGKSLFFYDDSICIELNNKEYKLSYNLVCDKVELLYEQKGREGEIVKYDGDNDGTEEYWIILYDNGDNLEIMPMKNMGNLTLGYGDDDAQTPGDIDKDGTSNTDIDKSIYSYNNSITKLNNYCSNLVTNSNKISVRSVGSNPDNPSYENNEPYTSEKFSEMSSWQYDDFSHFNGIGKCGDSNYEKDLARLGYYISNSEEFWLASRNINENADGWGGKQIRLSQWNWSKEGLKQPVSLCMITDTTTYGVQGKTATLGVRPVVKLSNI